MMRSRRWQQHAGGELDVFGATSYFAAGLPADRCPGEPAPGRLIQQANEASHGATRIEEDTICCGDPHRVPDREQLGLSQGGDELHHHAQLGVVAKPSSSSGKISKLAALLSFMASPSPRDSFRKTESPPPASNKPQLGGGDEPASSKATSSSSSRGRRGCCGGVRELDLGVATGDRRLQGVRVVRGGGSGDQQRWVVRCSAWDDEEHHESSDDSIPKDEDEGGGDDGDHGDWESDSSSDLFDLDLEYMC